MESFDHYIYVVTMSDLSFSHGFKKLFIVDKFIVFGGGRPAMPTVRKLTVGRSTDRPVWPSFEPQWLVFVEAIKGGFWDWFSQ